jgi:hypothetical protein
MSTHPFYVSTYCNHAHRKKDGKPMQHECRIIPPAALRAEQGEDYDLATTILGETRPVIMRHGIKE